MLSETHAGKSPKHCLMIRTRKVAEHFIFCKCHICSHNTNGLKVGNYRLEVFSDVSDNVRDIVTFLKPIREFLAICCLAAELTAARHWRKAIANNLFQYQNEIHIPTHYKNIRSVTANTEKKKQHPNIILIPRQKAACYFCTGVGVLPHDHSQQEHLIGHSL